MARIFKRKKKGPAKVRRVTKPKARQVSTKDLIDPVLYMGGLDLEKYPVLPRENETEAKKDKKPEEEIENPLNKR